MSMDSSDYPPMLAVSGNPFDSDNYLYEIKWDGIRAVARVDAGGTKLYSRNGYDITYRYPELEFRDSVTRLPAVLDGEIVVLENGLPSFRTLQTRDHLKDPRKIRAAAQNIPAIYMVFDILNLGGEDLTGHSLLKRKELLDWAVKEGPHLLISRYITGAGIEFFNLAKQKGLEGVMAKRLDSPYQAGKRSNYWIKFRNVKTMSCVICGYLPGSGERKILGSLILGAYQGDRLVYVGNAGSGLDSKEISFLLEKFKDLTTVKSPFQVKPPLKGAVWVEPKLVCEVSYLEKKEVLRHPTFLGLRLDLEPKCLVSETSIPLRGTVRE